MLNPAQTPTKHPLRVFQLGLIVWGVFSWLIMLALLVIIHTNGSAVMSEPNPHILAAEIAAFLLLAPIAVVSAWEYVKTW